MPDEYTDKKNHTYRIIQKNREEKETPEERKAREQRIVEELYRIFERRDLFESVKTASPNQST